MSKEGESPQYSDDQLAACLEGFDVDGSKFILTDTNKRRDFITLCYTDTIIYYTIQTLISRYHRGAHMQHSNHSRYRYYCYCCYYNYFYSLLLLLF